MIFYKVPYKHNYFICNALRTYSPVCLLQSQKICVYRRPSAVSNLNCGSIVLSPPWFHFYSSWCNLIRYVNTPRSSAAPLRHKIRSVVRRCRMVLYVHAPAGASVNARRSAGDCRATFNTISIPPLLASTYSFSSGNSISPKCLANPTTSFILTVLIS